jgi:hypothetical protein
MIDSTECPDNILIAHRFGNVKHLKEKHICDTVLRKDLRVYYFKTESYRLADVRIHTVLWLRRNNAPMDPVLHPTTDAKAIEK